MKLALTNHDMSPDNVVANKPLVFQMDPVKQDREDTGKAPKKKQKKSVGSMTEKNFGSIVDVAKIKAAKRIVIAWRVRFLGLFPVEFFRKLKTGFSSKPHQTTE